MRLLVTLVKYTRMKVNLLEEQVTRKTRIFYKKEYQINKCTSYIISPRLGTCKLVHLYYISAYSSNLKVLNGI